jgi:hypothetical protein
MRRKSSQLVSLVGSSSGPRAAMPMNAAVLVPTPSIGAPGANSSM